MRIDWDDKTNRTSGVAGSGGSGGTQVPVLSRSILGKTQDRSDSLAAAAFNR